MFLLIPGLLFWLTGLIVALPLIRGPVIINHRGFDVHLMIAAGMLNIVSIQIMTIGLLAKAYAT